jgi:regulator of protease activity HflC (stomatin/prohibitin superfamily)
MDLLTKKDPQRSFGFPNARVIGIVSAIILILNIIIRTTLVRISGQEVGVVVTPGGVSSEVLTTGWHFVPPWYKVFEMDKTVWVYTFSNSSDSDHVKPQSEMMWVATKDGIKIGLSMSVSWRIDSDQAYWIFQNVVAEGANGKYQWIEDNVIRAKAKSAAAAIVCEYSPIEVYGPKRAEIQEKIYDMVKTELAKYKILVQQIDIRDIYYSAEYEKAINEKKLAEQEVLRLQQVTAQKEEQLKQSKIDKDITIQEAEGRAKALQIEGQSIAQNPRIIQLKWIEAWEAGGSQVPQFIGGGQGTQFLMQLPNQ